LHPFGNNYTDTGISKNCGDRGGYAAGEEISIPAHTYSWQQAGRGELKMFARQGGGKSANEGKKKGQLLSIGGRTWNVKPEKRAAKKVHQWHGGEQQKAGDKRTFPNTTGQSTRCHFPTLPACRRH
jgi:hypothetical protein